MQLLIAIILSLLLAVHGLRKKSLSTSGAAAGLLVGLITFNHPHPVFGVILVAFYLSGSRVTKIGRETKLRIEEEYHEAGQRNVWQVVCNGGVGTLLALTHLSLVVSGNACHLDKPLSIAYLAHYACCAGDTFASEIGTAFASKSSLPILITSGRRVPHGTNGGITPIGTLASFAGGSLMGVVAFFVARFAPGRLLECGDELVVSWFVRQPLLMLLVLGGAFGLGGSMIDSVLGATLQATYHDVKSGRIVKATSSGGASKSDVKLVSGVPLFNNDVVNLLASGITAAIGMEEWPVQTCVRAPAAKLNYICIEAARVGLWSYLAFSANPTPCCPVHLPSVPLAQGPAGGNGSQQSVASRTDSRLSPRDANSWHYL